MARRRRSFFFDNINKRLLLDTTKNTKQSQQDTQTATGTSNTQYTTLAQVTSAIQRSDIDDLKNVTFSSVSDDQVLQYNSSTSKWENATLNLTSTVTGLTDTSLTSLQNGQYLVYNSSNTTWINRSLDLSSYVTDTDIAAYSNTAQMNTAIASSNTAMKNYVDAEVAGVVNSAPSTLDTLNELAAALGDDPDFATTTATNIGTKLAKSSNLSDLTNAATARTNLGLGTAATTASTDYATSAQGTKADTAHGWGNHASAGYGTSSFSGAYADLTGKPSLFSGAYADLSGKPTIPTNNNQLTNGAGYTTTTAQELSRTGLSSTDDLGSSSSVPLSDGWYAWGSSSPSNSPDNYALMWQLGDGGQKQQWVMANGGTNRVDLYSRRRSSGSWNTVWTKFWNSADFSSTNVSNWNTAYGWGNHASAGYSTFSGSYNDLSNKPTIPTNNNQLTNGAGYITSTVSGDIDIVGDVKAAGQIRATGWWNTNSSDRSGYAVEIGWSSGEGYLLSYSRTAGAYGAMNFTATDFEFHTGSVKLNSISEAPTEWNPVLLEDGGIIKKDSSVSVHGSGYLKAGYLNMSHASAARTSDTVFYSSYDDYIRKNTAAGFRSSLGLSTVATSGSYTDLSNKPTIPTNNNQLTNGAGYITNSGGTTGATANTVAKRNGSADINARLFRSSYANQSTIAGGIAFRVNNGTDNYIRFCSSGSAIRSFIGAGTSNFSGAYSSLTGRPTLGGGTPYLDLATGNYGTVKVDDDRGVTWAGYAIRDDWVLMSNGANDLGIYNDTDNEWMTRWYRNAQTEFHYNGASVAQTTSTGLYVSSRLRSGGTYLDLEYNATGGGGARLYDSQGTIQSYWYGNGAGEGGLLDNDAHWFCRARTGTSANIFYCNNNNELYIYTSYVRAVGSFRAPLFYDFNNTGYYAHLDSTSDSIRAAGNIVAYYSDERLKDISGNIENALDKVCTLDGFYYRPNELAQKYGYKDKQHVGLSAQQVQKILPEVIKSAPVDSEYMTVDYASVVPLLVEAIKELKAEIEELKK